MVSYILFNYIVCDDKRTKQIKNSGVVWSEGLILPQYANGLSKAIFNMSGSMKTTSFFLPLIKIKLFKLFLYFVDSVNPSLILKSD